MGLTIKPVRSKADLMKFIKLPWKIYKGDKCWVPPLIKDVLASLDPVKNPTLEKGKHEMYLAFMDNEPVGRIFAGYDSFLNEKKNMNMGYFSLFECINNSEVAKLLFDTSFVWFKENKIDKVIGPVSATGTDDDECKGLLIDCFDRPPVIMNSYNPQYYQKLMEEYGFEKDYDVFAYYLDKDRTFAKDPSKAIEYAQKRYSFRVDTLNTRNIENEILDIKHVLDLAVPDEWPDLAAPTLEDVRALAKKLLANADPELIAIARSGDEAIGFSIALPDFNQILIHLNGRITPLAALKYLWYKRKINCARMFVMFVIPSFRSKGVSFAIYYRVFKNGIEKGFTWGEGSTIGETNQRMRADIESFGGQKYKTYRIFKKHL
jgi:hypothetical protein